MVDEQKQPLRDANEQEFEFMAAERRNLLAGLWAAELLGLIGQAAHDYARRMMRHDPGHQGSERFIDALHADIKHKASRSDIRSRMAHLLHEARRQIRRERE